MKKKKKKRKVRIIWSYNEENNKHGKKCHFAYLKDYLGKPSVSGRWHIRGFISIDPKRSIGFYTKRAAKLWARNNGMKLLKKSVWKRKFKKFVNKCKQDEI